jgi:hypothetical protein
MIGGVEDGYGGDGRVEEGAVDDGGDVFDDIADAEDEPPTEEMAKLNETIVSLVQGNFSATKLWLDQITSLDENLAKFANLSAEFKYAMNGNLRALEDAFAASSTLLTNLTSTGETLLHYAVMGNQFEVAKWLIDKGVTVNAFDSKYNSTAFHYAAHYGNLEIVNLLVDANASFDCK